MTKIISRVSILFILLTFSGCLFASDVNPNEYSKLLEDLKARRAYPILRQAVEVDMLIKALDEPSEVVRFNAAHDLKALGSNAREALVPLIKRFADRDSRVSQVSFAASKRVMGDPYIPPPKSSWFFGSSKVEDPVDYLNKYLDSGSADQKIWSLVLLSYMGESAKSSVNRALVLLSDNNTGVRLQSQEFLQKIQANISRKLAKALTDNKPETRGAAALVMGLRNDASAIDKIKSLLNDSNPSVKFYAAEALARLGDSSNEVANILSSSLGSLSSNKESQVVKLLNNIGQGSSVNSYYSKKATNIKENQGKLKSDIERRAKNASIKVREKLLKDREKIKRAKAMSDENIRASKIEIPKLTSTLDTGSVAQRVEAVKALSTLAPYYSDAFQPIVDALNNEHASVRATAAKALGDMRKVEAVDNLILALEDESVDVQDSAVAALSIIGTPEALNAISAFPEDVRKEAVKRALRDSSGQIQALVRCSEARALCRLVLQESGSPSDTIIEEAASCAYQVQPGC